MRIAVIPARSASKRIPRKNVRQFAGKPMLVYPIEAALGSSAIDRVIVSTDDEEIADVARKHGAQVPFRRPAELADDRAPTVPVISHAIERCREQGWAVEEVCCIYPAVPFIRPSDIEQGFRLLLDGGGEGYAFPVGRFSSPIQRALRRHDDGTVEPFDPSHVGTRTQDLEPAYYDAGQFYWGAAESWLANLSIHAHARTFVLPDWRAVDVDTEDDWRRAELLFQAMAGADGR